jgi:hypothetical protein
MEVKQLDENDEDRKVNIAFLQDEETPGMECPSDRVRHQIAEAYIQLKACNRAGLATGVVLYNNAGFLNYIDCWTVTTAMFGDYGYRMGVPKSTGGIVVPLGAGFRGRRKVTRTTCRALSFVAVLKENPQDDISLEVYHNPFAAVRLEPSILSQFATDQFTYDNPHDGNFVYWQPTRIKV